MEIVIKTLNLIGFNTVTLESDPLVLYAGCFFILSILIIMSFISVVFSFSLIILGYNQNFLNYVGK
jgi:hypothetical protein